MKSRPAEDSLYQELSEEQLKEYAGEPEDSGENSKNMTESVKETENEKESVQ